MGEGQANVQVKPNYPDFKHKDSGHGLWLNKAPKWLWPQLKGLEFASQLPKMRQVKSSTGLADDSWKNLVQNPDKWWDNRTKKIKERSPDFKHKDTGEALWLSNCPDWVLSSLPPLKAKGAVTFSKRDELLSNAM